MKFLMILTAIVGIDLLQAKDITGDWHAVLDVQTMQLRIVFHIFDTDNILSATMDSPDQNAFGIKVTNATYADSILTLEIAGSRINYTGKFDGNSIVGTFKQFMNEFPLVLLREEPEKKSYSRPQTPKEPYPYYVEDVYFNNPEAGIKLAGTITLPDTKRKYPAVIMISGSGAQDRDEMIFEHRPFHVIADHLARNGIASLRFDDRGTAKSEGDFSAGTTYDFATDVSAAVKYLKTRKEIKQIGLLGHSEGGIIAPIVASRSKDVQFIILLAGTGDRGDRLLLMQQEAIMRASGEPESEVQKTLSINAKAFELVVQATDHDNLKTEMRKYITETTDNGSVEIPEGLSRDDFIEAQIQGICNPWMFQFMKLDPAKYLEQVQCPVLALNGAMDLQVPSQMNLNAIRNALGKGGNKDVTSREFPGLNHLFQECKTGLPEEYITIEQTIAPEVLNELSTWIKKKTKIK